MEKHINGWPVISKWLGINEKRQADLARLLGITPSAVSQIKQGGIMLNAEQLNAIIKYLNIEIDDMCRLYTYIFNARLLDGLSIQHGGSQRLTINVTCGSELSDHYVSRQSGPLNEVHEEHSSYSGGLKKYDVISFETAEHYEPALEAPHMFAAARACSSAFFTGSGEKCFGLKIDTDEFAPEFPQNSILLVDGGEYPCSNDIVIAKLRGGKVIIRRYTRENGIVMLAPENFTGVKFEWNCSLNPGFVQWMFPVVEATLKLRQTS
ncbi:XRE family transcriptional regulator [Lentisphaerota bacterium ZTH]|nr:LexA family transcriptional regulator [Lentisphaerota bacterium]WET06490.1 XRE family transcriptional regulator [Lentisphaerota bacterium ZTH]